MNLKCIGRPGTERLFSCFLHSFFELLQLTEKRCRSFFEGVMICKMIEILLAEGNAILKCQIDYSLASSMWKPWQDRKSTSMAEVCTDGTSAITSCWEYRRCRLKLGIIVCVPCMESERLTLKLLLLADSPYKQMEEIASVFAGM